ncbi:MAG TPA: aquaporin Z [Patescibacteria group bacterium]|nr:aquaporin Z [Patescibacteria group bacterium]
MSMSRRFAAELIGTFWLVFGGCGTAVIAAGFPKVGVGLLGVAFAFGLTLLTMAFAIGTISGCHINPAVTIGLWAGKRFPANEVLPYIIAQVIGGILASSVLYVIASGTAGFDLSGGFAANGYGAHSPGGYGLASAFVAEFVLTFMFLLVILGSTDKRVPAGFAPIPIGLVLTLIHLISIPVDNTSVNPARSTAPALFVGGWALSQLWLFWVAPIAGAAIGGWFYNWFGTQEVVTEELGREDKAA